MKRVFLKSLWSEGILSLVCVSDRQGFQVGSLSHMINLKASGYQELPEFPEDAPDPSVRNVEVSSNHNGCNKYIFVWSGRSRHVEPYKLKFQLSFCLVRVLIVEFFFLRFSQYGKQAQRRRRIQRSRHFTQNLNQSQTQDQARNKLFSLHVCCHVLLNTHDAVPKAMRLSLCDFW